MVALRAPLVNILIYHEVLSLQRSQHKPLEALATTSELVGSLETLDDVQSIEAHLDTPPDP